jgi:hypothetical protein
MTMSTPIKFRTDMKYIYIAADELPKFPSKRNTTISPNEVMFLIHYVTSQYQDGLNKNYH